MAGPRLQDLVGAVVPQQLLCAVLADRFEKPVAHGTVGAVGDHEALVDERPDEVGHVEGVDVARRADRPRSFRPPARWRPAGSRRAGGGLAPSSPARPARDESRRRDHKYAGVVPTSHLLAFAVTAFVIIVIPGPSVMFIVGRALAHGKRAALLTVLGNTLGEYVQVVVVAVGIGELVERSIVVLEVVKLAGAAYLVWLGVQAWRKRKGLQSVVATATGDPVSDLRTAVQGWLVGVSNPKTIIFLTAILPQFVEKASGHVPVQILLLGAVFGGIALVSDSLWGLAAGVFRSWFARSPRRLEMVGGAGGLAIVAVGVGLALSGRKD